MAGIGTLLVGLAGPLARKVLASVGFGIVSYAALSTALNAALSAAKGAMGGFTGEAAQIVYMSGIAECFSIIAGALVARVSMATFKKLDILK